MDGAWIGSIDISIKKAFTSRAFDISTKELSKKAHLSSVLVSVQSVVVDPLDRLWILDTGSPLFQLTEYGGPKFVCVDLKTNRVIKKILFPQDVAMTILLPRQKNYKPFYQLLKADHSWSINLMGR